MGIQLGRRLTCAEHQRVKELFTGVLLANEERGREATGVAAFWPDGSHNILKLPVCASEFVASQEFADFMNSWDLSTCTLLGHTRKPTKGSVWNPDNNQPIRVGQTVGIHNGTIHNDNFLFDTQNLERKAEVDSEIIFSMLNTIEDISRMDSETISAIQRVSRELTGYFTTLSVQLEKPHQVLVMKYNNPVSFHYSRSLQAYFFSSRYVFLRKAFGRQVVTEALESKTGYLFDAMRQEEPVGRPHVHFPLQSTSDCCCCMETTGF
ncbi:glucosamine--fructose-6-phosphate aminotransferase [Thiorhodovibrio litoralis]|nr:hypothetical protein [Thiorhodovibrio winogradskyi]MBK5967354.1 hypothetical protein [Thiorhodovibrio winogradskyi]WPL14355.1 glucosamine--fructose-6-phosphate aminotransferase [Thiorhodovibrio litoralis]